MGRRGHLGSGQEAIFQRAAVLSPKSAVMVPSERCCGRPEYLRRRRLLPPHPWWTGDAEAADGRVATPAGWPVLIGDMGLVWSDNTVLLATIVIAPNRCLLVRRNASPDHLWGIGRRTSRRGGYEGLCIARNINSSLLAGSRKRARSSTVSGLLWMPIGLIIQAERSVRKL